MEQPKRKLKLFYENENGTHEIQVGVDEAGKGCLVGPVFTAAVVWNPDLKIPNDKTLEIRDSKKLNKKKLIELRNFIIRHALAYSVTYSDHTCIDSKGIDNATFLSMHKSLDDIYKNKIKFKRILVDGNRFTDYLSPINHMGFIKHNCIIKGDDKYISIAAASILAKSFRDEYIINLCNKNEILNRYDLKNNKGYGTKKHLEAIREYGRSCFHRKTFKIKSID